MPFTFTVTALDDFGNTATSYNGTVGFGSSDPFAGLPLSALLTGGVGSFTATLNTRGNEYLWAFDVANGLIWGPAAIQVV
jgi:hypothetical protein